MNEAEGINSAPEPFYIAQTGECHTPGQAKAWVRARAAEARAEGARTLRVSQDPDHYDNILLMEGWSEQFVSDQGSPRWQIAASVP